MWAKGGSLIQARNSEAPTQGSGHGDREEQTVSISPFRNGTPTPSGRFSPLPLWGVSVRQSRALTGHRMGMANEDMDTLLELRALGRVMKWEKGKQLSRDNASKQVLLQRPPPQPPPPPKNTNPCHLRVSSWAFLSVCEFPSRLPTNIFLVHICQSSSSAAHKKPHAGNNCQRAPGPYGGKARP